MFRNTVLCRLNSNCLFATANFTALLFGRLMTDIIWKAILFFKFSFFEFVLQVLSLWSSQARRLWTLCGWRTAWRSLTVRISGTWTGVTVASVCAWPTSSRKTPGSIVVRRTTNTETLSLEASFPSEVTQLHFASVLRFFTALREQLWFHALKNCDKYRRSSEMFSYWYRCSWCDIIK